MSAIQVQRTTLIAAAITFLIALFAVIAEAFIPEEDAKLYVVPALYILIFTSGATILTTFRRR